MRNKSRTACRSSSRRAQQAIPPLRHSVRGERWETPLGTGSASSVGVTVRIVLLATLLLGGVPTVAVGAQLWWLTPKTAAIRSSDVRIRAAQAEGCPGPQQKSLVFYRYVGDEEEAFIANNRMIPAEKAAGGHKVIYFTDCFYSFAVHAAEELALPVVPTYRIDFTLNGMSGPCPVRVTPMFGHRGGARECEMSAGIPVPFPNAAIHKLK